MGRVATRIGVWGGADDDRLVDLHDWSLDRIGERACGGGAHMVHHHATLSRWDLLVMGEGGEVMDEIVEGKWKQIIRFDQNTSVETLFCFFNL